MTQTNRLSSGGHIDREQAVSFTFNGRRYEGFAGDTLASALLANGVMLVGRSFKYHRPRGIMTAGIEEPNALVQLERGERTIANLPATRVPLYDGLDATSVNCWPSPSIDLMAINGLFHRLLPAGFYYKTFMWPVNAWPLYEHFIRKAAGLGKSPEEPDPDTYDTMNAHADVLVVGGGPSGLMAALSAARTGARVILCDEQTVLGGQLQNEREEIDGQSATDWVADIAGDLAAMENVTVLTHTTAFGLYDHGFAGLIETRSDMISSGVNGKTRQRVWRVRAKRAVLATGAIERPLIYSDNDRPGCMLAGALRAYVNRYGVAPGKRHVIFTNNDDAYRSALDLKAAGADVACVVDIRKEPRGEWVTRTIEAGIEVIEGSGVTGVQGRKRVRGVEVMKLSADGQGVQGTARTIACDTVGSSGGWNPVVHLHSHAGGKNIWRDADGVFVPGETLQNEHSCGAAAGTFTTQGALNEGEFAGTEAASLLGMTAKSRTKVPTANSDTDEQAWQNQWVVPTTKPIGERGKHFLDQQNDVTVADVQLAAREGYRSVEHAKRYTTLGMATDQGRTGNIPGHAALAAALGQSIPETGTTTFRPPYTPVTMGALAGGYVGEFFDPIRRSAMHDWHENAGCLWEDVGQWRRPWYYPKKDETMHDAVSRECLAVRNHVGMLDASTLGKIDIQGPDAAEFLNRVYTNAWLKLAPGRCRYGLMLGEDGMVMDDGVTSCLGENHYLMTTTTGGAPRVMAWLEEWLQTEWPELRVYMTSVTEQFATAQVAGPFARQLLEELTDIDLSNDAFPFMSWRDGKVAGLPARVYRISFTGEISFEVNVPASMGLSLWTDLMMAGEKYGLTPFGTETMHVLRAEKGFIIVGQETDGTVTPSDLGMDWIVSKKKPDFIGRRSLSRADMLRADRKQLVGLRTHDPEEILPEGGQIVAETRPTPPMDMIGHVTSSYHSAALGHSIALALVKGGRDRKGETVYVPLEDQVVACEIVEPVFYDPEGARQNG